MAMPNVSTMQGLNLDPNAVINSQRKATNAQATMAGVGSRSGPTAKDAAGAVGLIAGLMASNSDAMTPMNAVSQPPTSSASTSSLSSAGE